MNEDLLSLRVTHINRETPDANSYFLEPAHGAHVPYRAGQFLTLLLLHNGHEVRRSYSLSSAPDETLLRLTIKRVQNGALSRHLLNTVRVGDILTSLPPAGRFVVDPTQPGDLVLLGAGSGITPLFSILKHVLRTEPIRRVTLLYSSSNRQASLFYDELTALHNRYPNRFRLTFLWSNPSEADTDSRENVRIGRLNNVMLAGLLPQLLGSAKPSDLNFFICGPLDYMRMIQFTLVFSGIQPEQIRRENFVIEPAVLVPPPMLAVDRVVRLRFHGRRAGNDSASGYAVDLPVPAHKSILQAALDNGIALPYSCRGGRCSTCVARCQSGNVYMTINDVLTERDLAEGWILTCTGYPESDDVLLDV